MGEVALLGEEAEDSEGEEVEGSVEVAMTRKVVRSNKMTSVALHAAATILRCLLRTSALGIRVWTILDQAYKVNIRKVYHNHWSLTL